MLNRLGLIFFVIINTYLCFKKEGNDDLDTLVLYFVILNYCSFYLMRTNYFSLNKIFYCFMYFFFGIAPLVQYKTGTFFFGNESVLQLEDFFYGGCFTILLLVINSIIVYFSKSRIKSIDLINSFKKDTRFFSFRDVLLVLLIIDFIVIYTISFDARGLISVSYLTEGAEYNYYVLTFIRDSLRLIPLFLLMFFRLNNFADRKIEILIFVNLLLLNFPTAISRYQIAIVYFPLLIVYSNFIRKYFKFFFLSGFLFVFPYLHQFRFGLNFKRENYKYFSMFNEMHFDSFQNTFSLIKFDIITYGNQLLGSMFFFIPRVLWAKKPIASSMVLCDKLNYDGFCNRAVSLFGEGYINFGFIGFFGFLLVTCIVNVYLDQFYMKRKGCSLSFEMFYISFLFLEFYILRGSLTSGVIKFCVLVFALLLFIILKKMLINDVKSNIIK